MKKFYLVLFTLLMQVGTLHTAHAQRNAPYAFDEGFGARDAISYLPGNLTGKGVLVAVIDNGMVFNHVNFLNPITFQTRIKEACIVSESQVFTAHTPEEMSKIQFDNKNEHGTHVAGIAAGSYAADGWQGIAPDADLFLADASSLNEYLLLAIERAFAVADSLDMPMVVNLSAGIFKDFDGYGKATQLIEQLTDNGDRPGRIMVVATGNSGEDRAYQECTIAPDGKARLGIHPDEGGIGYTLSFYCKALKSANLNFRFFLYDMAAKKEVTDGMTNIDDGSPVDFSATIKELSSRDLEYSPYTFYEYWMLDEVQIAKNIAPCVEITGPADTKIGFGMGFENIEDDYFTPLRTFYGKPNHYCLTPAVISVGNYDSHCEGTPIMPSSSFGVNKFGDKVPDVVAPGCGIISSCKLYDPDDQYKRYGTRNVKMSDGSTQAFNWRTMTGTSQATPLMAGICALMLQHDPTLTVNRMRELLHTTNDWNADCENAAMGPEQAGYGILNTKSLFDAFIEPTGFVDVTDTPAAATDSRIFTIDGREVKGNLAPGIYLQNGKKYIVH